MTDLNLTRPCGWNEGVYPTPENTLYLDCETRPKSLDLDLRKVGVSRYAADAMPIIITWAKHEGPVKSWTLTDFDKPPTRDDLPQEILDWPGFYCAWNAPFDRAILGDMIQAPVDRWLCAMAQAQFWNLPAGLDRAARALNYTGKLDTGKNGIHKFCKVDGARPDDSLFGTDWEEFVAYAVKDTSLLRDISMSMQQPPRRFWLEYWASERVNDRGLPINATAVAGGADLADQFKERSDLNIRKITKGVSRGRSHHQGQRAWLKNKLNDIPEAAKILREPKFDKPAVQRILDEIEKVKRPLTLIEQDARALLKYRADGSVASLGKFSAINDRVVDAGGGDWRLRDQYVFNGANQTGRWTSRGVQVQNLSRMNLGSVEAEQRCKELMEDATTDLEKFETSLNRNGGNLLESMVRPMIQAPAGKRLVWGDWSNIEARVLPWLAMDSKRLDDFRAIDSDPENSPDVYIQSISGMYGLDPVDVMKRHKDGEKEAKSLRQRGKIAELALGYGGGPNALHNAAAMYHTTFTESEARDIVDRWRKTNKWARDFMNDLWKAFTSAATYHDSHTVGRVKIRGQRFKNESRVWCILPCGRPLLYRDVKTRNKRQYSSVDVEEIVVESEEWSVRNSGDVRFIHSAIPVQNFTQASAASLLREAVTALDLSENAKFMPVVGHTHDELMCLVDDDADTVKRARTMLYDTMTKDPGWWDGLPVQAEISDHVFYSKSMD